MPAKLYRPVRVTQATGDAVIRFAVGCVAAHESGRGPCWWDGDTPTMDEAIAELCRRDEAHRQRARAASKAQGTRRRLRQP
jgi:hypothetical protein